MLAEAGIVGFGFFVVAFVAATRGILGTLRSVRSQAREYAIARCMAACLLVIVVWWNDNTLFGVQPETVLAALFIGMIAATPAARNDNRLRLKTIARSDAPGVH
jgi:O-antigen ligase